MHPSAFEQMELCVQHYLPKDQPLRVVDLGARCSPKQRVTHRDLLDGHRAEYIGVDIMDGRNVDRVMPKPYRIPVRSHSVDALISGQAFEHIPFFWATMLEIARVLKPHGHAFVSAPSRGHVHDAQDCWRYYPDAFRALAAHTGLELREAFTDFPPRKTPGRRPLDYGAIDVEHAYWGDSVGVFRKPRKYRRARMFLVRTPIVWWANRLGGLDHIPRTKALPARAQCGRPKSVPHAAPEPSHVEPSPAEPPPAETASAEKTASPEPSAG